MKLYDPGYIHPGDAPFRRSREQYLKALTVTALSMGAHPPPFMEDALRCAMAYRVEDVKEAAFGLSKSLRTVFYRLLSRNPTSRYPTAAALEVELRAQLARFGPYSGTDAVREVQEAMPEGEVRRWRSWT